MTDTIPKSDGKVILSSSMARRVAQDIINAEGMSDINRIMEESRTVLLQTIQQKDTIISKYKSNEIYYKNMMANMDKIQKEQDTRYANLNKSYIKSVRSNRIKNIVIAGIIAFWAYSFTSN